MAGKQPRPMILRLLLVRTAVGQRSRERDCDALLLHCLVVTDRRCVGSATLLFLGSLSLSERYCPRLT